MSRKADPALIGAFVLGAIALSVVTILLVAGDDWFRKNSQHMLYFEGAAHGLQHFARDIVRIVLTLFQFADMVSLAGARRRTVGSAGRCFRGAYRHLRLGHRAPPVPADGHPERRALSTYLW